MIMQNSKKKICQYWHKIKLSRFMPQNFESKFNVTYRETKKTNQAKNEIQILIYVVFSAEFLPDAWLHHDISNNFFFKKNSWPFTLCFEEDALNMLMVQGYGQWLVPTSKFAIGNSRFSSLLASRGYYSIIHMLKIMQVRISNSYSAHCLKNNDLTN